MPHLSDKFLVESLFSGRVRIVTPDGETYVSNGRPDADKVLRYLDLGYSPKGSAKWTFAGSANHEDRLRIADRFAAASRFGGFRGGCECCDGEGDHDSRVSCGG